MSYQKFFIQDLGIDYTVTRFAVFDPEVNPTVYNEYEVIEVTALQGAVELLKIYMKEVGPSWNIELRKKANEFLKELG